MPKNSPGVEISFFGAPGRLIRHLSVVRQKLVPRDEELRLSLRASGARTKIDRNYDAYLVAGLDFGWKSSLEPYRDYRAESHSRDNRIPISDCCFAQTLRARLRSTIVAKTIAKIRKISSAPIGLIPVPLPTPTDPAAAWDELLQLIEQNRDDGIVADQLDRALLDAARDLDAASIVQPEFTRASPLRTHGAYSRGALKPNGLPFSAGGKGENHHMNAQYGEVVLRLALKNLLGGALPLSQAVHPPVSEALRDQVNVIGTRLGRSGCAALTLGPSARRAGP